MPRANPWNDELRTYLSTNYDSMSWKQIARGLKEQLDVELSEGQIRRECNKLGLKKNSTASPAKQKEKAETKRLTVSGAVTVHRCL